MEMGELDGDELSVMKNHFWDLISGNLHLSQWVTDQWIFRARVHSNGEHLHSMSSRRVGSSCVKYRTKWGSFLLFGCLAFWQRCPVRCCMFPGDGRLKGFLNAMPNMYDFVNLSSQIGDRGISCSGPWWDQLQSPLGHSQGWQDG